MLPEAIIMEILTRATAKTIGKFRCVSKPWQRLLCQPQFIKAHISSNRQQPCQELLLLTSCDAYTCSLRSASQMFDKITTSAIKLDSAIHPDSWMEGIPSCDGLVLIRNFKDEMLLLNPTTGEIRELPVSVYALDPYTSYTMYGIGYDHMHHDYKVVTLSYYNAYYYTDDEHEPDCTEMFVNVFSSRNGSWKRAQSSPYDHAVGHITSGVYVNGCLHWLASTKRDNFSAIVGFDLAEEKFHEVLAPSEVNRENFVFDRLVVLEGCLCLCPTRRGSEIDIWVMKEYGVQESWTKFTLIDPEGAEFKLLCMLGKSEVAMVKDEDTADERLVTYNIEDRSCRVIEVHGIADEFYIGGTFMESLASPFFNC